MLETLVKWTNEGKLKPHISSVVTLQEAQKGLLLVANRTVTGKSVIVMNNNTNKSKL